MEDEGTTARQIFLLAGSPPQAVDGLQDDDACALCGQEIETCDHLLAGCVVARQLWFAVLAPVGVADLAPANNDDLATWWLSRRRRLDSAARPAFDSRVLLVCWILWKERNDSTFSSGMQELLLKLTYEADDWVQAGFRTLAVFASLMSQNLGTM